MEINPHQAARDLDFIQFRELKSTEIFTRMSLLSVVDGISFEQFMVKLSHADASWAKG